MIQSPVCAGIEKSSLATESLLGRAYGFRTHAAELVARGPLQWEELRTPDRPTGMRQVLGAKSAGGNSGSLGGWQSAGVRGGLEEELGVANGLHGRG